MTKEEKINLINKNIKSFLLKLNFKRKIKPELIKFSEEIFQSFYKKYISNQKLTNLLSNENSNIVNIAIVIMKIIIIIMISIIQTKKK